jgi:hypothetical protein
LLYFLHKPGFILETAPVVNYFLMSLHVAWRHPERMKIAARGQGKLAALPYPSSSHSRRPVIANAAL